MIIEEIQKKQTKLIYKKGIENESQHTPKKYRTALNNFNKYLEQNNITDITDENINDIILDYIQYLRYNTNLTNNTIKQYMILINNFFQNECKIKIDKFHLPKPKKLKPKYIKQSQYEEIQKYLDQQLTLTISMEQKKIIRTDQVIINLLFNTGLRIHEALKIKTSEILEATKDHNQLIQLEVIGKGKKPRTIIITPETNEALITYINEYSTPENVYIFESEQTFKRTGERIPTSTRTIERHLNRIAKELDAIIMIEQLKQMNDIRKSSVIDKMVYIESGKDAADNIDEIIDDISKLELSKESKLKVKEITTNKNNYQELLKPHNLRHSFAVVKMIDDGIPINAMKELLGHEDIKTTQIYTRINADTLSDAIAKTLI